MIDTSIVLVKVHIRETFQKLFSWIMGSKSWGRKICWPTYCSVL